MSIYNMSNKIKIKKHILHYSYLKLEKEEVDEICDKVEKEMRDFFKKEFPEEFKAFNEKNNKDQEEHIQKSLNEIEETSDINDDEDVPSKPPKNADIKKIYRKIAEKTHPDKTGDDSQAQIFSEAAEAYQENNVAKLLDLASSLNIEFTELSEDTLKLLENNITSMNQYIVSKKSTTAWSWHMTQTDEDKKMVIEKILKLAGIT
jgi:hypothetical protein